MEASQGVEAMIQLNDDWNLVTAWAEECIFPGGRNDIIWAVVARAGTNDCKVMCLQPEEQSPQLKSLHKISHVISKTMSEEAAGYIKGKVERELMPPKKKDLPGPKPSSKDAIRRARKAGL